MPEKIDILLTSNDDDVLRINHGVVLIAKLKQFIEEVFSYNKRDAELQQKLKQCDIYLEKVQGAKCKLLINGAWREGRLSYRTVVEFEPDEELPVESAARRATTIEPGSNMHFFE